MAGEQNVKALFFILIPEGSVRHAREFVALLSLSSPSSGVDHPVGSSLDPPFWPRAVYCCCSEAIVAAAGTLADRSSPQRPRAARG